MVSKCSLLPCSSTCAIWPIYACSINQLSYNLWQYTLGQSSFYLHSNVLYHFFKQYTLLYSFLPHPFQCWRLATRHQIFVGATLNWGNGPGATPSNCVKLQHMSHSFRQRSWVDLLWPQFPIAWIDNDSSKYLSPRRLARDVGRHVWGFERYYACVLFWKLENYNSTT